MSNKVTYGIDKKYSKGKLKSSRLRKKDEKNPTRALARMVDDEYKLSDPSKYKGVHVGGKVYTSKNKEPKKQYKPQKPKNVGGSNKKYGIVDNLKKKK